MKMNGSCAAAVATLAMAAALALTPGEAQAAPEKQTLVVCSPGSPGTTDDAQPRMDAFAQVVTAKAAVPLAAVYDPSEEGGVTRLKTAGLGLVSLPFFLKHEQDLGLHARLLAVPKGRAALERWALVAQMGRIHGPDGLAGFTIGSSVAFAPAFVRGTVLGGFGALPGSVKLVQSTAVLSALRKAANGEPTAVVLDATQEASLASLPFAAKLEVVARSPAVPVGVVVTVDARMPAKTWSAIESALLGLGTDRAAGAALEGLQLARFAPPAPGDDQALAAARKAYADASR